VNDTTAYVTSDTPRAGHIDQITGRLVTLVDGTRYVAASQQMIYIGSYAGCTWPKQCGLGLTWRTTVVKAGVDLEPLRAF
jgi:hypothetical protein